MTDTVATAGRRSGVEIFGHPRGLVTLFFTEMWERLSYYGMRALLVLFMTDQVMNGGMGLDDASATAIYGIYTAAVYLVALPGGWIADRLIGAQRSVFYGGIIIMSGHFVLAIPSVHTFFIGLLLVVLGTGLLKPNVSAVVGELYAPGDPRRDGGFSIFYMGINVGAMLGPLVCGSLAQNQNFGWHWGFAAAGVGMLFGVVQFHMTKSYLGSAGLEPASSGDANADKVSRRRGWRLVALCMAILGVVVIMGLSGAISFDPQAISRAATWIIVLVTAAFFVSLFAVGHLTPSEKKRITVFIALFLGSAMFWSGFEQAGSSLNLFADRYTRLELGWITLYSTWFQSINSIFIILFAPVFAYLWVWLAQRNLNPSTPFKFGIGLVLLAVGFLMMMFASAIVAGGKQAMPTWLILTYLFHTFGELALSPVGLSATTKLAPKRYVGQLMGIWFVSIALGNLIAGQIAGEFDPDNLAAFPGQYLDIVLTTAGTGLILLLLTRPLKKLMGGAD
ncbi:MAG: peptide MFS transporter [Gammaproteobacteria bacterium]|nr:peptide MFS transporter [Gammaproteobacteria bacterium]MDH4255802.1 peptide MFS transporter [Gammaproteobacteria bacterium]MDH5311451.1 peptide MFS transporter [Gammaproteobacteria bacterium]